MFGKKQECDAPNNLPLPPPNIPIEQPKKRSFKRRLLLGCFALFALCFACSFFSVAATELRLLLDRSTTRTVEAVTLQVAQRATSTSQAATATILALTPSDTPTITLTPSKTHTPTSTGTPTRTPAATATHTPKPTKIPVTPWTRETYYTSTGANLRLCLQTVARCAPFGTLERVAAFEVIGAARTEAVAGSAIWFKGLPGKHEGYIHSSILSPDRPAPIQAAPPPAQSGPVPAAPVHPVGVSAICNDGTYSYSTHRRGTCSHHGGVRS